MKPARIYSPSDILELVRRDASWRLGVLECRVIVKPSDLGQINVHLLEEGNPLGPFLQFRLKGIYVADRMEGECVVMECPFHVRGTYPVRVTVEKFRKMKPAPVRVVRAEFLRLGVPFPPRGWEKLCGISPRVVAGMLAKQRRDTL